MRAMFRLCGSPRGHPHFKLKRGGGVPCAKEGVHIPLVPGRSFWYARFAQLAPLHPNSKYRLMIYLSLSANALWKLILQNNTFTVDKLKKP